MPFYVAAAAAVVGAVSSIAQGQAANQQAKYQSEVMRQQAERERQDAANREQDYRRDSSREMAHRRAMMGASGVEAGEGSPLLVAEDMTGEAEYQALRIRSGGELQATRLEQNAALTRSAGRNAMIGSYGRAGASLLSAGGYAYRGYSGAPTRGDPAAEGWN